MSGPQVDFPFHCPHKHRRIPSFINSKDRGGLDVLRTILVTGGAGFIGSNFVIQRIAAGDRVVNLDKLTYAGNLGNLASVKDQPSYSFVHGGIEDSALVQSLLQAHQPDALVNFAAESHVDRSIANPEEFIFTNVVGTF